MIVLKSSRENIEQYEKAEAVVLFLCKECADHKYHVSADENRERFHPFDFCRSRRRERVHAEPSAHGSRKCSTGTAEM